MKKWGKVWLVSLAIMMTISLLAACSSSKPANNGGNDNKGKPTESATNNNTNADQQAKDEVANLNKDGLPIVNETVKLTIMSPDTGMASWDKMLVLQELEERTGIKLDYRNAPMDGFETKKNLVFASGDLPNIFYASQISLAEEVNYGGQGMLLPLEDLIEEYAPNIKKMLDDNPDLRKSITAPDGHIYTLPNYNPEAILYRGPLWYNGKFLKALGMEREPQTIDELYEYLKRVKEEDPNGNGLPDEIPLSSVKLDDIRMFMFGFWGMYNEVHYVDKEDTVHYSPQEEGYKGYLTFLNRLYTEELLDQEVFSQTDEQKKAKGNDNKIGLFSDYRPHFTLGGDANTEHPIMTPVSTEIAGTPVYGKHPGLSTGAFAMGSSNPAPEATIRWIDYLFSYEGAMLMNKGPEGVLWQYTDKDNLVKEMIATPTGIEPTSPDHEEYRATITPHYGIVTPGVNLPELEYGFKTDVEEWVDEQLKEKIIPIAKVPFPILFLEQDEQQEITNLRSDLDTYVKQMEAKFVTGQEPLSNWDKYVSQLKKMGSDRLVEIYQAAYDRWNR